MAEDDTGSLGQDVWGFRPETSRDWGGYCDAPEDDPSSLPGVTRALLRTHLHSKGQYSTTSYIAVFLVALVTLVFLFPLFLVFFVL